jgi:hypothetical protein
MALEVLPQHKKDIQRKIEMMASGSEMLVAELYKPYKDIYPVYAVYEEIQRILRLNNRRFRFFKRTPLTGSIIGRVEDFV